MSANVLDAAVPFHVSCCNAGITGLPLHETEEFANEFATVHLCTPPRDHCLHCMVSEEFQHERNPGVSTRPLDKKLHVDRSMP